MTTVVRRYMGVYAESVVVDSDEGKTGKAVEKWLEMTK